MKRKVVEFLEERKSIEAMEGVDEVSLLFVNDGVSGSEVFETVVCLIGLV